MSIQTFSVSLVSEREKHAEAVREVRKRRKVFADLVRLGCMTKDEADRRIAVMQSIADDYRAPDIFDELEARHG